MKLKPIGSNQTVVETENSIIFFSYETPVVCVQRNNSTGKLEFFRTNKFWSKTTSKHINNFRSYWDTLPTNEKEQQFFDNLIK